MHAFGTFDWLMIGFTGSR